MNAIDRLLAFMKFHGLPERGIKYAIPQTTEKPTVVKISDRW